MDRILILGPCGAGKSELARRLGRIHPLPVIHLDQHFWRPGWREPDRDEWHEQVERLIAEEQWIMDGNYGGTLARRLQRAQLVVHLDLPRRIFFPRVVWRSLSQLGRTRPDLAPGCPEQINLSFWRYAWHYPTDVQPRREARIAEAGTPVMRLSSTRQVEDWLRAGAPLGGEWLG